MLLGTHSRGDGDFYTCVVLFFRDSHGRTLLHPRCALKDPPHPRTHPWFLVPAPPPGQDPLLTTENRLRSDEAGVLPGAGACSSQSRMPRWPGCLPSAAHPLGGRGPPPALPRPSSFCQPLRVGSSWQSNCRANKVSTLSPPKGPPGQPPT